MTGSSQVIRGNALHLPLADKSVDLCVTSPPYFGLRLYTDNGVHYRGQIGSEPTPAEFVDALIAATREMVRVLKPCGSIWVNLGDKYAGSGGGAGQAGIGRRDGGNVKYAYGNRPREGHKPVTAIPTKSLIGIPWRYAIRCIDDLGLILRAEVIWSKFLSGGAMVYARTSGGDRPVMMRDLYRAYRPEDVQLWNGERWTRVIGWEQTPDRDDALEMELRTGERIGCTANHRWPTQRGLLHASEIRVGDVIETTRLPESGNVRTPALLPDDDIGWLVGLYIAEGSRSEKTIQFSGHINETIRHARLALIAQSLDGQCAVYKTSENGVTCNLSGSVIAGVIDRYVSAGTAKTKRLRQSVWQRSDEFLAAVVDGYLSGDGHYDAKNDRWRLGFTANDGWAGDLRTLAARLGAKISLRRAVHQGHGQSFPGWKGEWRWTRSIHHNAKADGQVVAIRASRAREFYDVEVADDPHLFALASGVLTHNSNGLPESVTDRVRRSHETWFHFTKEPRYFSAVDEIREAHVAQTNRPGRDTSSWTIGPPANRRLAAKSVTGEHVDFAQNPLGKLPGSVWTIPTQPLQVPAELGIDHFAAFPMEWPRRIIQGWSPAGVCSACGEGRRPVADTDLGVKERLTPVYSDSGGVNGSGRHGKGASTLGSRGTSATITGYACDCPTPIAPTTPATILDPFGGTGTTALVAKALGRTGISVDMSADYCRLAQWRTTDRGQLAAAMQVEKPEPIHPDQLDLFGEEYSATPPRQTGLKNNPVDRVCGECGYKSQYAIQPGRKCEKCGTPRGKAA